MKKIHIDSGRKLKQLVDFDLPEDVKLYSGFVFHSRPLRHKLSKWFLDLDEYPFHHWPSYVTAGGFILSIMRLKTFITPRILSKGSDLTTFIWVWLQKNWKLNHFIVKNSTFTKSCQFRLKDTGTQWLPMDFLILKISKECGTSKRKLETLE